MEVTGSGTAQDPFVINNIGAINVDSSDQFSLVLTGEGTVDSPWLIYLSYAAGATLDNIPDVEATGAPNGYVLAWDAAQAKWVPQAPTTAAAGSVSTGNSIEGDGSAGLPLDITDDNAKYITIRSTGVGLTDEGIARLVRVFADDAARLAASPPPLLGSLSMVENNPGRVDYWTGAGWAPIDNGIRPQVQAGEMLALSGAYPAGGLLHDYVAQLDIATDAAGDFIILDTVDLTGYAGVLHVDLQETGQVAWKGTVWADTVNGRIMGRAFRVDDGTPYAGFALTATVRAVLY